MSATLDELERLLGLLVSEQRKYLHLLAMQRDAMKGLHLPGIEEANAAADGIRQRLASIESRRRVLTLQAAKELRVAHPPETEPSLAQIAAATPDSLRRNRLIVLRSELRLVLEEVAATAHVSGRVAGAVLGHLNSAMRLLQSAMRDAGTYTRSGAPRMGGRLGAVEMVG